MPRQLEDTDTCLSLADFIAPLAEAKRVSDGGAADVRRDYLGAFIMRFRLQLASDVACFSCAAR